MQNEYRFDEVEHIHLLLVDGTYKPLVGTSSMASVLNKPGLTWWAAGLALEPFGWTNKGNRDVGWTPKEQRLIKARIAKRKIAGMEDEDYLKLLDEGYSAHQTKLKTSASEGTDMHAVMEEYIKRCITTNEGKPIELKSVNPKLQILVDWSLEKVKRFIWSEAHCYSKKLWLGGISDCGFEDKEGRHGILDFKSSREVYLSQFWQCVGYAEQVEENGLRDKDGNLTMKLDKPIEYVAVLPFGMKKPKVQYYYDMESGREAVRAMLLLYNKLK